MYSFYAKSRILKYNNETPPHVYKTVYPKNGLELALICMRENNSNTSFSTLGLINWSISASSYKRNIYSGFFVAFCIYAIA
jgi:hypothetical protein